MGETVSEDNQTRICPISIVYKNPMVKYGAPYILDEDTFCSATCEGIQTEARTIGGVTLPHFFDRVYCEKTQRNIDVE